MLKDPLVPLSSIPMILIRPGNVILVDKRPCRVASLSSGPDSLGHIQLHLITYDIFTGERVEDVGDPAATRHTPIQSLQRVKLKAIQNNTLLGEDINRTEVKLQMPKDQRLRDDIARGVIGHKEGQLMVAKCYGKDVIVDVHFT